MKVWGQEWNPYRDAAGGDQTIILQMYTLVSDYSPREFEGGSLS